MSAWLGRICFRLIRLGHDGGVLGPNFLEDLAARIFECRASAQVKSNTTYDLKIGGSPPVCGKLYPMKPELQLGVQRNSSTYLIHPDVGLVVHNTGV